MKEEPDISLSIVNSKARFTCFILTLYPRIISLKRSCAFNAGNNNFKGRYVTSRGGKIPSGVAVRGDGGVAGEGRIVVGVPKLHSWGKCTMPLMGCPMLALACVLFISLISHLGV